MFQYIRTNQMIDVGLALSVLSPLEALTENWAITGGANLFIRGISESINDVDIITSEKGVFDIIQLLSDQSIVVRPNERTRDGNVESLFAKIECASGFIEIMGSPANFIGGNWVRNRGWDKEIEFINMTNFPSLPLMSLMYERDIYKLLSNRERVSIIKKYNN